MSSTKPLSSLSRLLLVVNRHYADPGTISQYGWDFEKDKLQPADSGDGLARFICAELSDVHDADDTSDAENLIVGASYIEKAVKELETVRQQMELFATRLLALDFLVWLKESKRTVFTESLVQSWLDVHPLDAARDIAEYIKAEVVSSIGDHKTLTAENMAEIIAKVQETVNLERDLAEIVADAQPEPPAAPPAPPTT